MKNTLTVLIVDDKAVNRKILCKLLSDDYITVEATNGKEALDILLESNGRISAVLLDLVMPEMDGYELLTEMNRTEILKNIPVIVITGNGESDYEIKALELGAWDFVSKPIDAKILKFRLENAIQRSQLSAFRQLKYIAEYDSLTGVYNKTKYFEATRKMIDSNPDKTFVFVRFDIDRFKLVNSYYGTEEGDKLLKFYSDVIGKKIKCFSLWTFGRVDSDIFSFCTTFRSKNDIINLAEYSRSMLKSYNEKFDLVPSFGAYVVDDTSLSIESMLDRASLAVKECKGKYLEYYSFYDDKMGEELMLEQEIINEMAPALAEGQFDIYLQPKYSLSTNEPTGAEALVRWFHPVKGMVSPSVFVPIFERNGFISRLDSFVWEKVCKLLRKWLDDGKRPYPISVNVSRVNIYLPQFVDSLIELVGKYNITPELLNLELTESAYTDNPETLKDVMSKLQSCGFIIMMDDFGSGYSSLNILKDISVNVLKVDMRFLSDTEIKGRGENILASVIRMAKWLDIPVIVEGAETAEQVAFLRSVGCDYVQGFYFAKPMPVHEYEKIMEEKHEADSDSNNDKESELFDTTSLFNASPQTELMFASVLEAIVIFEFDGEKIDIIRVNDGFYELFGFDNKLLSSDNPIDIADDKHKEVIIDAFKQTVATCKTAECEYMRIKSDNELTWINLKLQYVRKLGTKHVVFGSLRDITAQKELDVELSRYRAAISGGNGGNTMLIVDDVDINREMLGKLFSEDYRILYAENGVEAIEIIESNNVDIILLDLIMPEMDGYDFLKIKQGRDDMSDIPTVIITSDDRPEEQRKLLNIGADDYITKPFVSDVVKRRVKNVFDLHCRYGNAVRSVSAEIRAEPD